MWRTAKGYPISIVDQRGICMHAEVSVREKAQNLDILSNEKRSMFPPVSSGKWKDSLIVGPLLVNDGAGVAFNRNGFKCSSARRMTYGVEYIAGDHNGVAQVSSYDSSAHQHWQYGNPPLKIKAENWLYQASGIDVRIRNTRKLLVVIMLWNVVMPSPSQKEIELEELLWKTMVIYLYANNDLGSESSETRASSELMLPSWKVTQRKYIEGNSTSQHRRGFYDFNCEKTDSKKKKNESVADVSLTVQAWYRQQLASARVQPSCRRSELADQIFNTGSGHEWECHPHPSRRHQRPGGTRRPNGEDG